MSKASGSIDLNSLKVAGEGASKYITEIGSSGISVHDASSNSNYVAITSSGMEVYAGTSSSNKVAEFKSYINIGNGHSNTYTGAAAIGTNLTVSKAYQTWVGRNNVADDTVLFGVGFGETTSSKKNAFEVHSTYDTEQTVVIQADGTQTSFAMGMNIDAAKPKTAYDLYGTSLNYTVTQDTTNDTIEVIVSDNINTGEKIKITYTYEANISFSDFYTATASGTNQSFTRQGANLTVTEVVNTSAPYQLTINSYTSTNISLSSAPAAGHNISFTFTTDTNKTFIVIDADNTSYTGGMGSIKSGGGINGKASGVYSLIFCSSANNGSAVASGIGSSIHGYVSKSTITASGMGSSIYGDATTNSTMTASGAGSFIHGEITSNGTMAASGMGSSIHGYVSKSTITASGMGSSVYGFTFNNSTMTASGNGSSIHGYATSNSTITASGISSTVYGSTTMGVITASGTGSFIHGLASNGTMAASGMGSSIHGYVSKSTITASGYGSAIYGHASNSTMTASGIGSFIHGDADGSTTKGSIMTASGRGSSIQGYVYGSTMTASSNGSVIYGYAYNSTITASGMGSAIYGYASESTMTASDAGSVALNESTHALKRAQLAIGSFNTDDSATTTTHSSNNKHYGTYAFIIGNGTGENARSNALTVDWQGNLDLPAGNFSGVGLAATYNSTTSNTNALSITNGSFNALTVDWSGNITVSNHDSPIGTLQENSASGVNIASSTDWHYVTGCQVELTPGSWIVSYSVMCTTLASGKRLGGALKNPDNSSIYYGSRSIMHASTSSAGAVSGVFPCIVTDDATSVKVRLMAFQTQGSSQDISGYIRAMRIV